MVCAQRDYRRVTPIPNSSSSEADITPPIKAPKIRDYTTKEKLKVIAGSVTALVIVGWFVVFALALMSAPWVILDRTGLSVSLPLFPKKRKCSGRRGTSHLCQERTSHGVDLS